MVNGQPVYYKRYKKFKNNNKMLISTTDHIPGRKVTEVLDVARGSTVRAPRNIGRDLFAGLKNIVGGEISEYTRLSGRCQRTSQRPA